MQKYYITKFDDIKGDYVIVEQDQKKGFFNIFGNGFFKRHDEKILENGLKTLENEQNDKNFDQNSQPQQNFDVPQIPTQNNTTRVEDSIPLLIDLYNRFRILDKIYQNLQSINNNFSQIFGDFNSINTQLQGGILNIHSSISGQKTPPQQNLTVPSLPSNAYDILSIVAGYLQEMREINYQLLNLFNAESINRQLNLIETSLSIQASNVTNLRLNNLQ